MGSGLAITHSQFPRGPRSDPSIARTSYARSLMAAPHRSPAIILANSDAGTEPDTKLK